MPPSHETAPGVGIVRLSGMLVPEHRREEWLDEWKGEAAYRWQHGLENGESENLLKLALTLRCLGAVPDAIWMRKRHGAYAMTPQDVRHALRSLARKPGFSTVVMLTMALAVGANAAIFSVVNAVLLRQLPFREPDRLVFVYGAPTDGDSIKVGRWSSYLNFVDIREQSRTFSNLAAFMRAANSHTGDGLTFTGPGVQPKSIPGAAVSSTFFETLGAQPMLGRGIAPEEDRKGGAPVIVLGHRLWQTRFGGQASIVGASILVNGLPTTVLGVMPPDFEYPRDAQFWIPLAPQRASEQRGIHTMLIVGRLKPGVTTAQAGADVQAIARRLEAEYPNENAKRSARVEPMHDAVVHGSRPQLAMLAGAAALVWLMGCTNIASLFLARAAARSREAAVRVALGAPRGRLVRQLLTESMLLSLAGGVFGIIVARWGVVALLVYAPRQLPRVGEISIDLPVLAFLFVVSVVAGFAFGALPAWHFARAGSQAALGGMTRDGSRGVSHTRARRVLVTAQVGLAAVLVVSAGLLLKSFVRLQHVEPGFDPENLLAVPLSVPEQRYPNMTKRLAFYDAVRDRIAQIPGVRGVSVSLEHPLSEGWLSGFRIEGRPDPVSDEGAEARVRPVSPGYFQTAGVPIRAGRDVAETDRPGMPGVVVVNEAFARKFFPGENPIGKRLTRPSWWPEMPSSYEIVGVVGDERFRGLQAPSDEATYFAFAQFTLAQVVLVRTMRDPEAIISEVRRAIWSLDADLPVENVRAMTDVMREQLVAARFNTGLLGLFAAVALGLAALGVYGLLSYSVAQRRAEIGIRMALGATRQKVLRLVVGEGFVLALAGLVGGLVAAALATRMLARLLFEVSTLDAGVFLSVAILLAGVAGLASFVPARRASRVNPLEALRGE